MATQYKVQTAAERRATWNGSNWIRKPKRLAIYMRDHFRCVYCYRDLSRAKPKQVTLDHILPVELGGTNEETNLVTCCESCNSRKQAKPLEVWLRDNVGEILRIYVQASFSLNLELAKHLLQED